jgi:predicted  nucleic acid-binding Zn-ribbon protein
VPILYADDKQRYTTSVNGSVANNDNEIPELKKQIQLLTRDKSTFESQVSQLQYEATKLELQKKRKRKRQRVHTREK